MLSTAERRVLQIFRRFLMTPGKMLCFYGPTLKTERRALKLLTEKELLIEERFVGGYSLTTAGYTAMHESS